MTGASEEDGEQPYAMQVMLEEVASLRKRVKELEGGNKNPSNGTSGSADGDADAAAKQIQQTHEAEKAELEMSFMNQLVQIQTMNRTQIESLQKELDGLKEEREKLKNDLVAATASSTGTNDGDNGAEQVERIKKAKDKEIANIMSNLEATEKEFTTSRKKLEESKGQLQRALDTKEALINENTELRIELGNQAKVIESLTEAMGQNEDFYKAQVTKLQTVVADQKKELTQQESSERKGNLTFAQNSVNDDEIPYLQMQLADETKAKEELEAKLKAEEEKVAAAESKSSAEIEKLQKDLQSVTTSYKTDVARLEAEVEKRNNEEEQLQAMKKKLDESAALHGAFEEKLVKSIEENRNTTEELRIGKETAEQELEAARWQLAMEQAKATKFEEQLTQTEMKTEQLMKNLETSQDRVARYKLKLERRKSKNLLDTEDGGEGDVLDRKTSKSFDDGTELSPKLKRSLRRESKSGVDADGTPAEDGEKKSKRKKEKKSSKKSTSCDDNDNNSSILRIVSNDSSLSQEGADELISPLSSREFTVSSDFEQLEQELISAKTENEALEKKLQAQYKIVGELRAELAASLATQSTIEANSKKEYETQRLADKAEIQRLEEELKDVRVQLDRAEKQIVPLKNEIKLMTTARMKQEENSMDTYDKRVAVNQKSYEIEMNTLKVEITNAKLKKTQMEKDYQKQVRELEEAIESLNFECDKELDEKQAELDIVQHKYDLQVNDIDRLRREKEHLTACMSDQSSSRRNELEEAQTELFEKTAENTTMAREIHRLEMRVNHQQNQENEIRRLKQQVKSLDTKIQSTNEDLSMRAKDLERAYDDNALMKEQVRSVELEKRALEEKLNIAVQSSSDGDGHSMMALKERNEQLKKDLIRYKRKLDKMERCIRRVAV